MQQKISIAAALAFLALWPRSAEACSVCFSAEGDVRIAFIVSTVFLTALPLLGAAAIIWWVRRRFKQHQQDLHDQELLP